MTLHQEHQEQAILVVDDEEPVLHLIESLLASHGRSCRTASDPAEALNILETETTDLVISDAHLTSPASRELLDRARHLEIPVVFTIRQQSSAPATQALVGGAYEVLKKPFELSRLPGIVARALQQQRLVRENEALRDQLALYQIITVVNASLDEQDVLKGALSSVESAFDADRARLFIRKPGQKRLTHWRAGALYGPAGGRRGTDRTACRRCRCAPRDLGRGGWRGAACGESPLRPRHSVTREGGDHCRAGHSSAAGTVGIHAA